MRISAGMFFASYAPYQIILSILYFFITQFASRRGLYYDFDIAESKCESFLGGGGGMIK